MTGRTVSSRYVRDVGKGIMTSSSFQNAARQKHHLRSTLGSHSYRVACVCAFLCDRLEQLGVHTEKKELVTAALCHDLGMIGRYENRYHSGRECLRSHPLNSRNEAVKLIGDLSEMQTEAIEKHMWPLCDDLSIHHKETVLIGIADKLCAVADFVRGERAI